MWPPVAPLAQSLLTRRQSQPHNRNRAARPPACHTPFFWFFSRTACELCYYKANAAVFGFVKFFFLFLICISPVDRSTRQEQKHVAVVAAMILQLGHVLF